jgi:hypothetical protein
MDEQLTTAAGINFFACDNDRAFNALAFTASAALKKAAGRPFLGGLRFEIEDGVLRAVATDGLRLAVLDDTDGSIKAALEKARGRRLDDMNGGTFNFILQKSLLSVGTRTDKADYYPDYKKLIPPVEDTPLFNLAFDKEYNASRAVFKMYRAGYCFNLDHLPPFIKYFERGVWNFYPAANADTPFWSTRKAMVLKYTRYKTPYKACASGFALTFVTMPLVTETVNNGVVTRTLAREGDA